MTLLSCEIGVAKPSRDAFLRFAAECGLDPCHCLLIDDTRDNILAARALGFHVLHHNSPEDILGLLHRLT
ncbi:MAG: HAD-IA family hydrolase [Candidatus Pacebacteria bacterium]|nr:HAD-IA family hydrolase [Candidatus Paceibacterota bacterium]